MQTDRQTETNSRQIDGHTEDRQADGQADRQTDRHADKQQWLCDGKGYAMAMVM